MRWRPTTMRRAARERPEVDGSAPEPPEEPEPVGSVEPPRAPVASALPPVVLPRWVQLVLLPLGILGLWELARAIGSVLLILIFAGVAALILNPPIKALQRRGVPRAAGIPLMYLAVFAVIGAVGVLLSTSVANQVSHFQNDLPSIERHANRDILDVQNFLNHHGIHVHLQKQGHTALQTIVNGIKKRSGDIVSFSSNVLQKLATISFGLVLSLVLSIYFLVYARPIGDLVRRIMPPGDGTPEDDFPRLIQKALLGYVRGQILFSLIMGASATLSLFIFGVVGLFPPGRHYALFFGGFYGLMELVPYLGPILGALPPVLVALFDHPIAALWVIILFVVLQQLEGHLVAPQVFRISLRINPILIIVSLLIGDQLYGVAGALLALPVASVLRETVVYLRRHMVLEPWTVAAAGGAGAVVGVGVGSGAASGRGPGGDADVAAGGGAEGGGGGADGADGADGGEGGAPEPCSECEAPAGAGDAFCRACGAALKPRVRTPG